MPCHVLIILLSFLPVHAQNFLLMSESSSSRILQWFFQSLWNSSKDLPNNVQFLPNSMEPSKSSLTLPTYFPIILFFSTIWDTNILEPSKRVPPKSPSVSPELLQNTSIISTIVPLFSGLYIYAVLINYIYENTTGIVFFNVIYLQIYNTDIGSWHVLKQYL